MREEALLAANLELVYVYMSIALYRYLPLRTQVGISMLLPTCVSIFWTCCASADLLGKYHAPK